MLRWLPGLLLLASCIATPIEYPDNSALITDIETARELWQESSVDNYRFVYSSMSFGCGTPDIVVTVRRNSVRSVRFVSEHTDCQGLYRYKRGQDASTAYPDAARSVEDLFDQIDRFKSLGVVKANFHPVYGVPVSISYSDREIEDDFANISVSGFEYFGPDNQ